MEARADFFDRIEGVKNQYVVKDELKSDIRWKKHHLSNPPPDWDFMIIFMRNNILTYYRPESRKRIVNRILSCLRPGGLFIIGCHESLPYEADRLNPVAHFPFVFPAFLLI